MAVCVAVCALLGDQSTGQAQIGMAKSSQKISVMDGGTVGWSEHDVIGDSAAQLGDHDGDGVPDVAVGGLDYGGSGSVIWVLFLHPNGTVKNYQKIGNGAGGLPGDFDAGGFGASIAALGDHDGDGVDDLVVGAPSDDRGRGTVWVLFLNPNGTVKNYHKIGDQSGNFGGALDDGDSFGSSAAAGDLDNDGLSDLVVGAPHDDDGGSDRGAVWVLFLDSEGMVKNHQKISATDGGFTGTLDDRDRFGASAALLDDLDKDGRRDLVVGAPYDGDGGLEKGALWILFLDDTGTVNGHQKISSESGGFRGVLEYRDRFGSAVSAAGDLDGDGNEEIAVGAPAGDYKRGVLWVLFPDTTGMVKFHQKIGGDGDGTGGFIGSLDPGDNFAVSVASAGDVNNDLVNDFIVGEGLRTLWVLFMSK